MDNYNAMGSEYIAMKSARGEAAELELNHLKTLISYLVETNHLDDSITLTISKKSQMVGKDWADILRMSEESMKHR